MISAAHAQEAAHQAAEAVHHGPFYATAEFWVGVAFVVVVALAFRPVFRAIAAGLDARGEQIRGKLDEARKLREDAQAMLADYQRKQRDAMREADAIVAHAQAEAERAAKQAAADLEASVARREQQALDRVRQAEAQALAEVRNMAVDIAVTAAARLVSEKVTADIADAMIDDSIKALPEKLH
jgi:F-type H+-transporting ATPase subunit b